MSTRCLVEHAGAVEPWPNGATLRVSFLDGDALLHERIEHFARRWIEHANLSFEFGRDRNAEIRVSLGGKGPRALGGATARSARWDEPTVSLGGVGPDVEDADLAGVVLHCFGHVLGLPHADQGVMAPAGPWPDHLAAEEHARAALGYPPPTALVTPLFVGAPAFNADISRPDEVDVYQFEIGEPGMYTVETGGITDTVMALYDGDDVLAEDDDGGFFHNARVTRTLDPGRYGVRVWHYMAAGTGRYGIWVRKGR